MTDLRLHRHMKSIRRSGDAAPTHVDIYMEISFYDSRIYAKLSESSPSAVPDVDHAAESLLASGRSTIPPDRLNDAVVESGWVVDRIFHDLHAVGTQERRFLYAVCGGALFELTDGLLSRDSGASPPEVIEISPVDGHLPVALSPSAVLALIEYGAENEEGEDELMLPLSISRKRWSPYPPHSIPESLQLDGLPGESLSMWPDLWSQPFGALPLRLGSVLVSCDTATAAPSQALLLDAIIPLENGTGKVECEAECSFLRRGRREAIGAAPVTLLLDAGKLLSSVTSAITDARPGRSFNPITGDRFGMAPMLLTDISSGELMKGLR